MKTTILTFALALATMPLTFARNAGARRQRRRRLPNRRATATTKKHHKKAVKKTVKPAASNAVAPVKK